MVSQGELSAAQARRIALGAQGFADARPRGRVDRRHLRKVLDRIGLIQIDSVNVLARSQELVLFARLGPHPRTLIPDATAAGELFEYWVHEASHVPTAHYHLYRWSMAHLRRWSSIRDRTTADDRARLDAIEAHVAEHGPVVASDLSTRTGPKGPWWDWDDNKVTLEQLFDLGRLAATRRDRDFARIYDLPERVIPADALARPPAGEVDARKQLLVNAAGYHGLGTAADLADYHRQKVTVCRPLLAELVEEGRLQQVRVEGWKDVAYKHPDARLPRRVDACALLSPFDPVVWHRGRAERLFGFHYRIEIYVPKDKRRYGYYVLPFLLGDTLVGRVDLKADRHNSTLLVQAAWAEPGVDHTHVAHHLAKELRTMATWLNLDKVLVRERGDLSRALTQAC